MWEVYAIYAMGKNIICGKTTFYWYFFDEAHGSPHVCLCWTEMNCYHCNFTFITIWTDEKFVLKDGLILFRICSLGLNLGVRLRVVGMLEGYVFVFKVEVFEHVSWDIQPSGKTDRKRAFEQIRNTNSGTFFTAWLSYICSCQFYGFLTSSRSLAM